MFVRPVAIGVIVQILPEFEHASKITKFWLRWNFLPCTFSSRVFACGQVLLDAWLGLPLLLPIRHSTQLPLVSQEFHKRPDRQYEPNECNSPEEPQRNRTNVVQTDAQNIPFNRDKQNSKAGKVKVVWGVGEKVCAKSIDVAEESIEGTIIS